MGNGHSAHQPDAPGGALVPGFGLKELSNLPLLPYEKQLADAIGVTIDEYKKFKAEVLIRSRKRAPEYDHIPDIVNDPTGGILTSIVVGLVLSAISYAITPKPKAADNEQKEAKQLVELESTEGRRRFNNTQGFDSVQGLASLGQVIPVLFGKYFRGSDGENYGGIYASPQLIWSRMFSYGSHQGFKGLYMVGEVTMELQSKTRQYNLPIQGISIGQAPLQSLHESQYAVYFNSAYPLGRITIPDFVWGTRGFPPTGDPEINNDIFTCPTNRGAIDTGFCMTYTPTNNTEFGCYGTVPNGTAYKHNFRVVSFISKDGPDDPSGKILSDRRKIAGRDGEVRGAGMLGNGRGYSPMMGVLRLNGSQPMGALVKQPVNINDTCDFVIRGYQYTDTNLGLNIKDTKGGANDINNAINNMREAADDALQVGESFMMGRTIWQVIRRSGGVNGVWVKGGPDITVTLRMREHTGGPATQQIGVVGNAGIGLRPYPRGGSIGVTSEGNPDLLSKESGWIGTEFWNLCRFSLGVVRNQRPTGVTEIGIQSNVWGKLEGMCNFGSLIRPAELRDFDNEGVPVQSGTTNQYIKRTSVFTLQMRAVNLEASDEELPWVGTLMRFCVTGSTPQDQFNFIRIQSNGIPRQMEFRFVPKNGTDLGQYSPPNERIYRLNAKTGALMSETVNVGNYGTFTFSMVGDVTTAEAIAFNAEMATGGTEASTRTINVPTSANYIRNDPQYRGEIQTICCQVLGPAPPGGTYQGQFLVYNTAGESFMMQLTATAIAAPLAFQQYWGRSYAWTITSWIPNVTTVEQGTWRAGDIVARRFQRSNMNSEAQHFSRNNPESEIRMYWQIGSTAIRTIYIPASGNRIFEFKSQYGDVSHYSEFSRSSDTGPEHRISYVNESIATQVPPNYPLTTVGLALRSSRQIKAVAQLNCWMPDGIRVRRTADGSDGPSNLFTDLIYYLLVNKNGGLGTITNDQWIDLESFKETSRFLEANRLYFDGAVEQRVNLRAYATQLAPYFLCNFVIAAGKFAMTPAIPVSSSGAISPSSVSIAAIFNKGNIIEGSYQLDYLDRSERLPLKAIVQYRVNPKYKAPITASVVVREIDTDNVQNPEETFDLSGFCTSRAHALLAAKYLIAVRRLVDHTITFQTLPNELSLAPGQYIKVYSENMPPTGANIAAIDSTTGKLVSPTPFDDGTHEVALYNRKDPELQKVDLEIKDGHVVDERFYGALFSTWLPGVIEDVYMVEELNLDEEGLVTITASHFPMNGNNSAIAELILNDGAWFVSASLED